MKHSGLVRRRRAKRGLAVTDRRAPLGDHPIRAVGAWPAAMKTKSDGNDSAKGSCYRAENKPYRTPGRCPLASSRWLQGITRAHRRRECLISTVRSLGMPQYCQRIGAGRLNSDKLPWSFFSTRLSEASNSLIGYENLSSTAADGFASRPTRCRSSMRS